MLRKSHSFHGTKVIQEQKRDILDVKMKKGHKDQDDDSGSFPKQLCTISMSADAYNKLLCS